MKRPAKRWLVVSAALVALIVLLVNRHHAALPDRFGAAAEEATEDQQSPAASPAESQQQEQHEGKAEKPAEMEEPSEPEQKAAEKPSKREEAGDKEKPDEKKEQKGREPLKWERPRFEERSNERLRMVRMQIERRGVKAKATLEAMRYVPRHLFVPGRQRGAAYADHPLPIGYAQTISQPYIVAFMTELLDVKPGEKVLEIGTGSGYQAAVLSELTPHVHSIEIIKELAEQAGKRLKKLGYKTVKAKQGDGYYGWKEHAPFDGIIVTAAAGHVPPPLVEQLKPEGVMVIPVGGFLEAQRIVVVTKEKDGRVKSRSVLPVRFVPMTGRVQEGP